MFDTHCHLDEAGFDPDRNEIVEAARQAGLVGIVTLGTTLASSRANVQLATTHDIVHAAVGIHPNYTHEANEGDWEQVAQLASSGDPHIVAIGETGLDRYWDYAPIDLQVDYFRRHIELSRATGKPFVVHCRDAEEDVVRELRTAAESGPLHGVMHSFCGSQETCDAALELGLMISFAGMLTFKRNDNLRTLAATVPHDRLMVETDAPYLSPEPKRGRRNEPAHVVHTAAVLAECLGITPEECDALTTANAKRFFGLD